jgi:hypothetical protein
MTSHPQKSTPMMTPEILAATKSKSTLYPTREQHPTMLADGNDITTTGSGSAVISAVPPTPTPPPPPSSSLSSSLFFADATLDLTVAHDIADTPEAKQRNTNRSVLLLRDRVQHLLPQQQLPLQNNGNALQETTTTTTTTTTALEEGTTIIPPRGILSSTTTPTPTVPVPPNVAVSKVYNDNQERGIPNTSSSGSGSMTTTYEQQQQHYQQQPQQPHQPHQPHNPNNYYHNNDPHSYKSVNNNSAQHVNNQHHIQQNTTTTFTKPKYPRDIVWMGMFLTIVPISLLYPIVHTTLFPTHSASSSSSSSASSSSSSSASSSTNHTSADTNTNTSTSTVLAHHPLSFATLHAITWTILISLLLIRFLYHPTTTTTTAGSTSSSSSLVSFYSVSHLQPLVSRLLTSLAPCSIVISILLTMMVIYIYRNVPDPNDSTRTSPSWIVVVPLLFGMVLRDIYIYRYYFTRRIIDTNDIGYISRRTVFHELYHMSVYDILLHKSKVQHKRLLRIVTLIIMLQSMMIVLWRSSILHVWQMWPRTDSNTTSTIHVTYIYIIGLWCTSCITKCITYLISAAIMFWSMEQTDRLNQLEQQQQQQLVPQDGIVQSAKLEPDANNDNDNDVEDDGSIVSRRSRTSSSNYIPEAYRTVDASVYQSVAFDLEDILVQDENDDDDHFLWDEEGEYDRQRQQQQQGRSYLNNNNTYRKNGSYAASRTTATRPNGMGLFNNGTFTATSTNNSNTTITMKSIIGTGLRVSFGSIVRCGMVSGLSQWIYIHMQYWDHLHQPNRSRPPNSSSATIANNTSLGGFQGMVIESSSNNSGRSGSSTMTTLANTFLHHFELLQSQICQFVQSHNDLPMTHVATYYKSYHRASRDITWIIQESGTCVFFCDGFLPKLQFE